MAFDLRERDLQLRGIELQADQEVEQSKQDHLPGERSTHSWVERNCDPLAREVRLHSSCISRKRRLHKARRPGADRLIQGHGTPPLPQ